MNTEATYVCDSCGEEIVVPIDPSAGSHQQYVEDCPVCCNPSVIHVEIEVSETQTFQTLEPSDDSSTIVRVWAESEQD